MTEILDVLNGVSRWCQVQGDSLDVLRWIPPDSVSAVITDPPYSSGGMFRGDRVKDAKGKYFKGSLHAPNFTGDSRDQRAFLLWAGVWLGQARVASQAGSPVCVFTDWRQLPQTSDAVQLGGWSWRGVLPWVKSHPGRPVKGRFRNGAEYVVWGSNGPMPLERGVGYLSGSITAPTNGKSDRPHPCLKPDSVMDEIVKIVAPGGVVLDPFSGAGSTGTAALRAGLRFIGIELVPEINEIARARLAEAEGKT